MSNPAKKKKKTNIKIETILRTKSFNSLLNIVCNSKFIKHSLFKQEIALVYQQ